MEDGTRHLKWTLLGTRDRGEILVAVLTTGGSDIPYEYSATPLKNGTDGAIELRLVRLGSSLIAEAKGYPAVRFDSDMQKVELLRLAAEAALTWEPSGRGTDCPEDQVSFVHDTQRFTLRSFGVEAKGRPKA